MADTNIEDIAKKLQNIERQIIALRDCYAQLQSTLVVHRKDPEGHLLNTSTVFKVASDSCTNTNAQCYKWIATQVEAIQTRLVAIENKDTRNIKVKIEVEGNEERIREAILEEQGDITPRKAEEKIFEMLSKHPVRKRNWLMLLDYCSGDERYNTYEKIGRKFKISGVNVRDCCIRVAQQVFNMHKIGSLSIESLPPCLKKYIKSSVNAKD